MKCSRSSARHTVSNNKNIIEIEVFGFRPEPMDYYSQAFCFCTNNSSLEGATVKLKSVPLCSPRVALSDEIVFYLHVQANFAVSG